jgi:hypothetical protein
MKHDRLNRDRQFAGMQQQLAELRASQKNLKRKKLERTGTEKHNHNNKKKKMGKSDLSVPEEEDEDQEEEKEEDDDEGDDEEDETEDGGEGDDDEEVVSVDEGGEEEAEEQSVSEDDVALVRVDDDDDEQQRHTLLGRLLRSVGFVKGLASKNQVSYVSMQQTMQAGEDFTAQETKQAEELYGIDLTTWAAGGVTVRNLTSQLRAVLEGTGNKLTLVQVRCGNKNGSRWQLQLSD